MSKLKVLGKLNPKQYSEMLGHLTRKKIKNPFIKAEDIVVNKKPEVEQREMFDRFNVANPRLDMADGGRIGFNNGSESLVQNKPYKSVKDHSSFQKITLGKNKGKYRLILGGNKNKKTYYGTVAELQKIFDKKAFINPGNRDPKIGGDVRPKDLENKKYPKNYLPRNKFLKFLKKKGIDIKRPDVFAKNYEIDIKPNPYFKGDSIYNISKLNNQSFVDNIITRQVRAGKGTDKQKIKFRKGDKGALATRKKRKASLLETDPTGAGGTEKFNYHHIRQIAGGVPLTTDDVVIINQRLNSQLQDYDKTLNRISEAIRKNNILALESMNAKDEGAALDYMKRVDELNESAEKIVNSAIDKLPKKYKGYVGFNQFTLPRNEYGLPISNEPMLIKKVGGMPVSKDAIDLTNLSLKDEAKFRKIVKQQAERGKVGKIDASKIGTEGFIDLDLFRDVGRGAGSLLKAVPTPLGTGILTAGFGVDPTSGLDRATLATEAALAPQLVQQSARFSPAVQKILNLGASPKTALRIARITSPIGIASLVGEGLYQGGKFAKQRFEELAAMSPEQRQELRSEGARQAFDPFQAAGGGIAKLAGDPSGAMLESMNPDSQGLPGLLKRVRNR